MSPAAGAPGVLPSVPAFDPSINVKAMNEESVRRLDDLQDAHLCLMKEMVAGLRREIELRAEHARELRDIETKRLNAVHDNDSLNARILADRQANALEALARKTAEDRESLRSLVDQTARTLATATGGQMVAVEGRLLTLERSFSEDKGKQAVADPRMEEFFKVIAGLRDAQSVGTGKSAGLSMGWGLVLGGIGLVATILSIVGAAIAIYFAVNP